MIDLEKQKEPSEEEIQEWVNEVYEYAVNLYTNHNMSWGEVRQELINQGLNVEDATTVGLFVNFGAVSGAMKKNRPIY